MKGKNRIIAALAGAGIMAGGLVIAAPADANAAPTKYRSCAAMNKAYAGGVAKSSSAKNTKTVRGKKVAAKSVYRPKVNAALYNANKGLDRDRDGIACER
jgi:hypothetical protein